MLPGDPQTQITLPRARGREIRPRRIVLPGNRHVYRPPVGGEVTVNFASADDASCRDGRCLAASEANGRPCVAISGRQRTGARSALFAQQGALALERKFRPVRLKAIAELRRRGHRAEQVNVVLAASVDGPELLRHLRHRGAAGDRSRAAFCLRHAAILPPPAPFGCVLSRESQWCRVSGSRCAFRPRSTPCRRRRR